MAYQPVTPEITVLLLGDSEVGKSTFLSYVDVPPAACALQCFLSSVGEGKALCMEQMVLDI